MLSHQELGEKLKLFMFHEYSAGNVENVGKNNVTFRIINHKKEDKNSTLDDCVSMINDTFYLLP
jgi:hypothetical protein